ncbi:hypothetical protein V8C44DRAFT_321672 [Trichoderma aethiopicum]
MPYVDNDIPLATKRKWDHDPNDDPYNNKTLSQRTSCEAPSPFYASSDTSSKRKTLHPTKRLRAIHDIHPASHHHPFSREPSPTTTDTPSKAHSNTTTLLLPCHVCHRRPTKKSDLDSFARCQSCREQTCFICMRECQGRRRTSYAAAGKSDIIAGEEALSRSFPMDDADATTPSIPHVEDEDVDVDVGDDNDVGGERERFMHHGMICSRCCVEKGAEGEVICLGCLSDPYTNTP